jgi:hypothetical protein
MEPLIANEPLISNSAAARVNGADGAAAGTRLAAPEVQTEHGGAFSQPPPWRPSGGPHRTYQ